MQERMRGERRGRREQQHVIVMRGDERVDGDKGVTAGTVLDDDRLAPFAAEPVGEQASADIRTAAGAERQDQFHRPCRPSGRGARGVRQYRRGQQT